MANKSTIADNVFMNGDDITQVRKDLDQPLWEWGIDNALKNLLVVAPFQSSQSVLKELARSGKKVLIKPAHDGEQDHAEPIRGVDSVQYATPTDWRNATPQGKPPLACSEGNVEGRDATGTPIFRKGNDFDPARLGTGAGSDVCVYFTSQDHLKELMNPGGRPDEVLLHELVHALRIGQGITLCLSLPDNYDTVEEFYAILIANIYRSECGHQTLRASHFGKTNLGRDQYGNDLTDDARFYAKYQGTVDSLVSQMPALCQSLAAVRCRFNPICRALMASRGQRR